MDRDPLDLRDRARDLEDLAVRDVAVGLEDHLALRRPRFDAIGDRLARLVERGVGPSPWPMSSLVSPPGVDGLASVRKVATDSSTPTPCRAGGTSTFSPPRHLDGKEHERHELEHDIDHRRHVDVLVPFLIDVAAK